MNDVRERAFAAGELRLRGASEAAWDEIRAESLAAHAEVRAKIRDRTIDREAFLAEISRAPLELRDHLLEEILGVAYPPFVPTPREGELVLDAVSGVAEILFAIDHARLAPDKTFVDLGAGAGKVVLLAALMTGAHAIGIELDPKLVAHANAAADALGLSNARFSQGDLRTAPLPDADTYYMYIPFIRSSDLMERLAPIARRRPFKLFAAALDVEAHPWIRRPGRGSYWLEMYESR